MRLDVTLGEEHRKPGLQRGYVVCCAAQAGGLKTSIDGDWMHRVVFVCATDNWGIYLRGCYGFVPLAGTVRPQTSQ